MVSGGRYRSASEVVRDGLRLLEGAEHRRLLEKWIYTGLTDDEAEQLPTEVKERARQHFQGLVDTAMQDVEHGRVKDGPTTMQQLRVPHTNVCTIQPQQVGRAVGRGCGCARAS